MRYVIYGAGATGGVMGAALSRIGREVVLIARGRHLEAIREHGLTLRTPLETVRTELTAVERSADVEFREGDAVLLTVKTQDAFAALDELRDAAGDGVPVICAQNGVATEREALRRFRNVYGMVVRFPGMLLEPGVVANYEPQGGGEIELGRCPEGVDDVVEQLAADLTSCGFDGQAEADVMRWKHEKLLINVGSALAGVFGPGADTAAMRERLVAETRAVLVATGIDLPTPEGGAAAEPPAALRLGADRGRPAVRQLALAGHPAWPALRGDGLHQRRGRAPRRHARRRDALQPRAQPAGEPLRPRGHRAGDGDDRGPRGAGRLVAAGARGGVRPLPPPGEREPDRPCIGLV